MQICLACGTQFPHPADTCPICCDERQFVPGGIQRWTTLEALREGHSNEIFAIEDGVYGVVTKPAFAIGQQAHLVLSESGNVLWDCIALVDPPTVEAIEGLGGIGAIAISHPHYYTTMVEWSRAFGGVPIYLHEDDRQWVMYEDPSIHYWGGETLTLDEGVTLIRCGGHFAGGIVMHTAGRLFCGDIIQVAPDTRWVSFMYSYPNMIPLNRRAVERIVDVLKPYAFDRIFGAFGRIVQTDGKGALARSAERYYRAIAD